MKYRDYEIKFTPNPGDRRPFVDIIKPNGEKLQSFIGGTLPSHIKDYKEIIDCDIEKQETTK